MLTFIYLDQSSSVMSMLNLLIAKQLMYSSDFPFHKKKQLISFVLVATCLHLLLDFMGCLSRILRGDMDSTAFRDAVSS